MAFCADVDTITLDPRYSLKVIENTSCPDGQDVSTPTLSQEGLLRSLLNRNQAIGEAKSIPEVDSKDTTEY